MGWGERSGGEEREGEKGERKGERRGKEGSKRGEEEREGREGRERGEERRDERWRGLELCLEQIDLRQRRSPKTTPSYEPILAALVKGQKWTLRE